LGAPSLRAMTRLLLTPSSQTEEVRPVPVRACDQLGYFSQRPVAFSFVQHAAIQNPDLVSDAVPLAHQYGPGWKLPKMAQILAGVLSARRWPAQ